MPDPLKAAYTLDSRAFAPGAQIPGSYTGDNRGYGMTADANARVHSTVDLYPGTQGHSQLRTYADTSYGPWMLGGPRGSSNAETSGQITTSLHADGRTEYNIHASGSNPLVPGAPAIDNHAQIIFQQTPTTLSVTANLTGDKYPAVEWALRDSMGTAVFMGGFMPTSQLGLVTNLPFDFQRQVGTMTLTVALDKAGDFTKIVSAEFKGPDGKVLASYVAPPGAGLETFQQWNQQVMGAITPPGMPAPEKPPQQHQYGNEHQNQAPSPGAAGAER